MTVKSERGAYFRGWIHLHEFPAQNQGPLHEGMIYAVSSKAERNCRHVVKWTATSMGLELVRKRL